ncbi:solute carrier family 22 member 7-like [Liolophura sinensis]|uniref:solute carrier family 22 member 7-like n=1 Tax=Liolophura sinensis TaxID=3198878 RepID=UPI0031596203
MSIDTQGKKIDQLFKSLGVWGSYQILQMVLVKSLSFPACFQLYIYIYLGYQPPLRCQSVVNMTSQSHINPTPNISVDTAYHKTCVELKDYSNGTMTETGRCRSGYDYDLHKYSTLVTEWDLVCDRTYQAQLTQTVLVIGQGVGATFFTSLADRFGRKKICLISQWIMLFVSVGTAFAPSILVFTLIRFVLGAVQQGHVMSIHVMPLEVLPRSWRATIHLLGDLLWTSFLCVLVGLAYGFKDYNWRYFQLTTVLATVVTLIPNMLFLDESLRWLLANGRTKEARRIIKKAAKINGIHPDDIKDVAEDCMSESIVLHASQNSLNKHADKKDRKPNLLDIFRHTRLRRTAFIVLFTWIVNAGTSFGLSLTAAKLSGDRFMNYFLISVVNLPAAIISYIAMQRIGRRTTCIVSHFIAGSALLSAALINTYLGKTSQLPSTTPYPPTRPHSNVFHAAGPSSWVTGLTVVGKFGISMSWGTLSQYTRNCIRPTSGKTSQLPSTTTPHPTLLHSNVFHAAGPSGWVTGLTVVGTFGISMSGVTLFLYTPELYPTKLSTHQNCIRPTSGKTSQLPSTTLHPPTRAHSYVFHAAGPSSWVTGLTVVGKFGISMSWGTLFLCTPELFPTNLRSVGLGIASSASRIGGMLAPFATIVIDYYPWLPGTIYGSCCIGVGFLLFLLAETVDKELPQTIEEINSWNK